MSTHSPTSPLTIYQEQPLNAGTPLDRLCQSFLTPNDLFFIRSHGPLPIVDQATYRLKIHGLVKQPLTLSLDELLTRFPLETVTATLVCAGNRRNELADIRPLPSEVPWHADAISTASWRGVRLRDVLQAAGVAEEARYVAFLGLDSEQEEGEQISFGSSISIDKALAPEVLLACEMNGEPLPPAHGFPLRVLIPGYIGARSVKWLHEITLQEQPSHNYFQDRDYKLFPPDITAQTVDWSQGQTLEEPALNAVICQPCTGATHQAGPITIQGYALAGKTGPITRVELSHDNGITWIPTSLKTPTTPYAWCLWETTLHLPPGAYQLIVRAWDSAGQTQPGDAQPLWNFKGYANNACHRIHLHLS